jgi:hypothetical protein
MGTLLRSPWTWVITIAAVLALYLLWHQAIPAPVDAQTRAILAGATTVEVYRTDGMNRPRANKPCQAGELRIGGFLVTARGQDQGADFAARLAAVLSNPETYSDSRALCYNPGVAFRVKHGAEAVDVLICFRCDNFYLGPPTDHARETASFHDTHARRRLVQLAKEAFPEDQEIQGLEEDKQGAPR